MRTFICLEIPEEIKKIVKKIQEKLPEFSGKKTEEKNLHLTLKFLGEIDEKTLKKVNEKLSEVKFKKFNAKLGEIGVFDKNFIRIVWIKIENCDELQKEIDEKLSELFEKEKRFMSHLTIARIKSIKNKEYFLNSIEKIEVPKKDFLVEKFHLKESNLTKKGPIYKNITDYSLE
ncbi:MAG: RNA 2',3'-cyclic phosphodiesterase [Candidatus Pacearchaeota archaeon]